MERRLKRGESEQEHMFRLFFKDWDKEKADGLTVKDYVKDQISKDPGIPWHQIGPKEVQLWRDKGFQPVALEEWWREPNDEEKKRRMKMMGGASLRKDM